MGYGQNWYGSAHTILFVLKISQVPESRTIKGSEGLSRRRLVVSEGGHSVDFVDIEVTTSRALMCIAIPGRKPIVQ